jgi:hypothetical protein
LCGITRCDDTAPRCEIALLLLIEPDAFDLDHRRCGDLEAGVDAA